MLIDIAYIPIMILFGLIYFLMFWHIYTYFDEYNNKVKKENKKPDLKLIRAVDKSKDK